MRNKTTNDGTRSAVKVARSVWSEGKLRDNFKELPITINKNGVVVLSDPQLEHR